MHESKELERCTGSSIHHRVPSNQARNTGHYEKLLLTFYVALLEVLQHQVRKNFSSISTDAGVFIDTIKLTVRKQRVWLPEWTFQATFAILESVDVKLYYVLWYSAKQQLKPSASQQRYVSDSSQSVLRRLSLEVCFSISADRRGSAPGMIPTGCLNMRLMFQSNLRSHHKPQTSQLNHV